MMNTPRWIKTGQPKTEIAIDEHAIKRILDQNWWGQMKIDGHKVQIHVPSERTDKIYLFNRHGSQHSKFLPKALEQELRSNFTPTTHWQVLEGEWCVKSQKIYIFDLIGEDGHILDNLSYAQRYEILKNKIYERLVLLPVYSSSIECMQALTSKEYHVEGLVLKSKTSLGFSDSSIIKCRKKERRFE